MKQELMKSFLNDKIKEVIEIIVTITMIFIFNGEEKMLGISVYFQDYDENYLKKAAQAGAKYVFTSLQIPEEDYSDLDQKLI